MLEYLRNEKKSKESTIRAAMYKFNSIAMTERLKGKDSCDFDKKAWQEVIDSMSKDASITSIIGDISILNNYIKWARDNGHTKIKIDINKLLTKELKQQIIESEVERKLFSRKELMELLDKCINGQDSVIIALEFEGLEGKNKSQLTQLKKQDYDSNNRTIKIWNSERTKVEREIMVGEDTAEIIDKAINEKIYMSVNGNETDTRRMSKGQVL